MTQLTLGGENGTAWGNSSYGNIVIYTPPGRTYVVGNVRADFVQPTVPDVTIGEEMNITLGLNNRGIPNYTGRYNMLRDIIQDATPQIVTNRTQDGTPWFHEPERGMSMLVKCHSRDEMLRDYWGVITGGNDNTTHPRGGATIRLSIFILSELDRYSTHKEVRENHER